MLNHVPAILLHLVWIKQRKPAATQPTNEINYAQLSVATESL